MADVYLDNAATTPLVPSVLQCMTDALARVYGNPSSVHRKGLEAERAVSGARRQVAQALGAEPGDVIFTSGGTEANGLAILGAARARQRRRRHIITGKTEHSSVLNACRLLEEEGFAVTYVPVDKNGRITAADVLAHLRDDTALVSLMWVNNELGTVHPVADIAAAVKARSPETLVHVDGVQALGKLPINVKELPIDLLSVSAHKIHGPKGVGALWIRPGVRIVSLLGGGTQERGLRPGTENVPGIIGFGAAAEAAAADLPQAAARMARLRERLWEGIQARVPWAVRNTPADPDLCAPHILNVSFPGLKGEVLVHSLAEAGIYVSTGSACSSRRTGHSHVLTALGLADDVAGGALRLSLSRLTTEEDVDTAAAHIGTVAVELAELVRG
ncbi:MAG TPA: cysteine desulfurase family protein [Limnochordales bacterium]|nr:cysteine desulfurase family protein [Limnochordales bacterium]